MTVDEAKAIIAAQGNLGPDGSIGSFEGWEGAYVDWPAYGSSKDEIVIDGSLSIQQLEALAVYITWKNANP